jgi:hypothetical protein
VGGMSEVVASGLCYDVINCLHCHVIGHCAAGMYVIKSLLFLNILVRPVCTYVTYQCCTYTVHWRQHKKAVKNI